MSYVVKRVSNFPKNKIIGSGTSLDTARFQFFLSREFDVAPNQVYAPIIGEHGDSQVAVWSHAQIAGEPVLDLLPSNTNLEDLRLPFPTVQLKLVTIFMFEKAQPISEYH